MLLVRLDGYGRERIKRNPKNLRDAPTTLSPSGAAEATQLIECVVPVVGDTKDDAYRMGEDVAVPKSLMAKYVQELRKIATAHESMSGLSPMQVTVIYIQHFLKPESGQNHWFDYLMP